MTYNNLQTRLMQVTKDLLCTLCNTIYITTTPVIQVGTSEKFHCVAVSGGERQGNTGCWAPVQGHVHICSAIEKISCLNSLVTSVTDFYLMPGEIKKSTTK